MKILRCAIFCFLMKCCFFFILFGYSTSGPSCSKLTQFVKISNMNITNTLLFFVEKKSYLLNKNVIFVQQKITVYLLLNLICS